MTAKTRKSLPPLAQGQLWKTAETYIQIMHLGKTLIDYKLMKELGRRAIKTHTSAIAELEKYLLTNKARLVKKAATA
jgi:hypothetical protein